jgi:hypothetical protein
MTSLPATDTAMRELGHLFCPSMTPLDFPRVRKLPECPNCRKEKPLSALYCWRCFNAVEAGNNEVRATEDARLTMIERALECVERTDALIAQRRAAHETRIAV